MMSEEHIDIAYYYSPIGPLAIEGRNGKILSISFEEEGSSTTELPVYLQNCIQQLEEYFSGRRTEFDLDLEPEGTDFQQEVWQELLHIPFGKTQSYLDIAKKLGDPNATRAVGNANGKNKIAVVIPCHRVIGSDGTLTGYAGGVRRKKWLVDFENQNTQPSLFGMPEY